MSNANETRRRAGFTLVEVLVAIGIFALLMVIIAQVFGSFFYAYRNARTLQRDLENAQQAVNLMAKELRTGTIFDVPHAGHGMTNHSDQGEHTEPTIRFFDHSQATCIRYAVLTGGDGFRHLYRGTSASDFSQCQANEIPDGNLRQTASGRLANASSFFYFPSKSSGSGLVGFFAVYLELNQATGLPVDKAFVQTMVSLRDYEVSGILEP